MDSKSPDQTFRPRPIVPIHHPDSEEIVTAEGESVRVSTARSLRAV
jgi:hypothetical protein